MRYLFLLLLLAGCDQLQTSGIQSGDAVVIKYDCLEKNDCSKAKKGVTCHPCKTLGALRIFRNEGMTGD